jgi:hypothetical protein
MTQTTPNDSTLLAAIDTSITALGTGALVVPFFPAALLAPGMSLNYGRLEDATVNAWFFSLYSQGGKRIGDVAEEPAKALGEKYTRDCDWVYRFKYIRSFSEELDSDGKRSDQLFSESIQRVMDGLGLNPKLGSDRHVDRHFELQIKSRTVPAYGQELAHTADGFLQIKFWQQVKP